MRITTSTCSRSSEWSSSSSASSCAPERRASMAGDAQHTRRIRMPFGDFVNQIPPAGFLAIHLVLFLAGAYFAYRSFGNSASTLGYAFSLFALAELSYMTYHLNWTTFLFAHTISEVLDLFAFVLVFVAATQRAWTGATNRA